MNCSKCGTELRDGAVYCDKCGKKQVAQKGTGRRKRGNGQGSVYKPSGGKSWVAVKVIGYEPLENGKLKPVVDKKQGFKTKTEALEYLPNLGRGGKKIDTSITFKQIYDLWLPEYRRRGRSIKTENGYISAMNYFRDIWYIPFREVTIDDLQECMDNCPHGKATRHRMKVTGNLLYGYAIPRGYTEDGVNRASFIFLGGEKGNGRIEFTADQIETIKKNVGKVPYADWVYTHIYLGFRPHEFITLDIANYDRDNKSIIGGEKTEAGTNRTVTISPKIQPIIDDLVGDKDSGPLFRDSGGEPMSLRSYREECFLPALEAMGFDNPTDPNTGMHRYTPHCCRHTFATLMKNVEAPAKDKLSLIGHTSEEMLGHYQHTRIEDLRKITDLI